MKKTSFFLFIIFSLSLAIHPLNAYALRVTDLNGCSRSLPDSTHLSAGHNYQLLKNSRNPNYPVGSFSEDILLSEEAFEWKIQKNQFLVDLQDNSNLSTEEKAQIKAAHIDQGTRYIPRVNRPINDFHGDVLVVGGGRRAGGMSDIEKIQDEIKGLEDGSIKYNEDTGELLSREEIESRVYGLKQKRSSILETFYTINYDPINESDFVDSITDLNGILSHLPKHRFGKIIFESVNTFVFLNKNTWRLMEELCKPSGEIIINSGSRGYRLLPIVLEGTKWESQVLDQLKEQHGRYRKQGVFFLNLKNTL